MRRLASSARALAAHPRSESWTLRGVLVVAPPIKICRQVLVLAGLGFKQGLCQEYLLIESSAFQIYLHFVSKRNKIPSTTKQGLSKESFSQPLSCCNYHIARFLVSSTRLLLPQVWFKVALV